MPLGNVLSESVLVVLDTDITRTVVSGRGRLVTNRKLEGKAFQIVPVGKYSPKEEEVALCEVVVEGAEIGPIILNNQANKTVRISKGEEVRRGLPIRSIKRVKFDKQRKRG